MDHIIFTLSLGIDLALSMVLGRMASRQYQDYFCNAVVGFAILVTTLNILRMVNLPVLPSP